MSKAANWSDEDLTDTVVRYILDVDGALLVFENVPARVSSVTGEQLFSPQIVQRIQQIALSARTPSNTIEARVYDWEHAA